MVDREIINEWISKADEDFEFAKINLQEEKPFIFLHLFRFLEFVSVPHSAFRFPHSNCLHPPQALAFHRELCTMCHFFLNQLFFYILW
jgi:hypothetical protein